MAESSGSGSAPESGLSLRFVRELEHPVTRIALDASPHVAALGPSSVFVRDRRGFHELPLPAPAKEAGLGLRVFYGRDYRVRLVGSRRTPNGVESVYLRAMPEGLKPAPYELGRLANLKAGGLVAVLGTADPEIVCRPADVCLIKRVTGWETLPAAAELSQAAINAGSGWVLAGQQLLRAAEREWVADGPRGPWHEARELLVLGGAVFVIETERSLLHSLKGGVWQTIESPVGPPSSLWGVGEKLWLVGARGVSHFDGTRWLDVLGEPSGLISVLGRSADEVWFAGESGLYRLAGEKAAQAPVDP